VTSRCGVCDVAWISGRASEYMETLTDNQVGQKCVEMLNLFLGKVRNVPKLKNVTRYGRRSCEELIV